MLVWATGVAKARTRGSGARLPSDDREGVAAGYRSPSLPAGFHETKAMELRVKKSAFQNVYVGLILVDCLTSTQPG